MDVCPNWVFSSASNVHIAKERECFIKYTPFSSTLSCEAFIGLDVDGVGTIAIPVELRQGEHNFFCLREVLHCPAAFCNVLGGPLLEEHDLTASNSPSNNEICIRSRETKRTVATLRERDGYFSLSLARWPHGICTSDTAFRNVNWYSVTLRWADMERWRWLRYKAQLDKQADSSKRDVSAGVKNARQEAVGHADRRPHAPRVTFEDPWTRKSKFQRDTEQADIPTAEDFSQFTDINQAIEHLMAPTPSTSHGSGAGNG
ncbi:MAG: hypothetical protein Q9162_002624 [Coniocarpon cinnabarinum]